MYCLYIYKTVLAFLFYYINVFYLKNNTSHFGNLKPLKCSLASLFWIKVYYFREWSTRLLNVVNFNSNCFVFSFNMNSLSCRRFILIQNIM